MQHIFVNLKRFDVPRRLGGLCPAEDPIAWIEGVLDRSIELSLGRIPDMCLTYMLPEGLLAGAARRLERHDPAQRGNLQLGCQGVHWEDVAPGANFGAFTAARPASAVRNLGATWALIGHSEERRMWQQVMAAFEPGIATDRGLRRQAGQAADTLVNAAALAALAAGLEVLICVGESAAERGEGEFAQQKSRIEAVLCAQVAAALRGVKERASGRRIVIGYEPIWAIGPGRIPPGSEYIAFVSSLIKDTAQNEYGLDIPVVYGGGLKVENAALIAAISTLGGGLVGLTRFTGEIGFDVDGLAAIIERYRSGGGAESV